jgi:hypothetical protein
VTVKEEPEQTDLRRARRTGTEAVAEAGTIYQIPLASQDEFQ